MIDGHHYKERNWNTFANNPMYILSHFSSLKPYIIQLNYIFGGPVPAAGCWTFPVPLSFTKLYDNIRRVYKCKMCVYTLICVFVCVSVCVIWITVKGQYCLRGEETEETEVMNCTLGQFSLQHPMLYWAAWVCVRDEERKSAGACIHVYVNKIICTCMHVFILILKWVFLSVDSKKLEVEMKIVCVLAHNLKLSVRILKLCHDIHTMIEWVGLQKYTLLQSWRTLSWL